jgi:hypothetical protein
LYATSKRRDRVPRFAAASLDLSFFATMAKSERRMNVGAAASFACSLAWGWVTERYVTDTSSSVAINLVLIWVQWGLLLLAACWAGLRLSSLLFGTPWRLRVLLGEPVPTDITEEGLVQGFSENRAPFFGLLAGAVLLSWGAVQLTTNNYLTRYNTEGYYATMLRSESPAEQVAALQEVCGVLATETRAARPVRERVAFLVLHGDGEVKPWAIWAAGQMGIRSVEGALLAALASKDDGIRAEAALAVTRLELASAGPALLAALPEVITTPRTARAFLQAVSRLRLPAAGPLLLPLVDLMVPEVRIAAWRAIGRSGDLALAPQVWARFEAATEPVEQCAIADALKFLSTGDQLASMGAWFDARPRRGTEACAAAELSDRPLLSGDRPDTFEELERQTLRTKMMIAIFNIAGPGTDAWMKELAANREEPPDLRAKGREILKLLEHAPPRVERRLDTP